MQSKDGSPLAIELKQGDIKYQFLSTAEHDFFISKDDNDNIFHFQRIQNQDVITSEYDLVALEDIYIKQNLYFKDKSQWTLFFYDDFQEQNRGWSKSQFSTCQDNENIFLGGHCNFANEDVFIEISNLPKHKDILIKFNVHFIDEWQGETFYSKLDTNIFYTYSYNWCDKLVPWFCRKYNINTCGREDVPDKLSQHVSYFTEHTLNKILLTFGSNLKSPACQASWGIDDVMIFIK